jgi:hypothetical protein
MLRRVQRRHNATAPMRDIEEGSLHRMMETEPSPDSAGIIWTAWGARLPGLEQQRAEIETAFRQGGRPIGTGKPRVRLRG